MENSPPPACLAAVSVGVVDGRVVTDLCYDEDHRADVDLNFVALETGIVEIQGTAEGATFSPKTNGQMIKYGRAACTELFELQQKRLLRG